MGEWDTGQTSPIKTAFSDKHITQSGPEGLIVAMVLREELLFLSNSKKQNDGEGARLKMKKRHLWILGLTFALIISWNILLTLNSWSTTHQHEFSQLVETLLAREVRDVLFLQMFCFCFKERKGRRIQETLIEGDILVRNRDPGDPYSLNAHLTGLDRLWPNGIAQLGVFKRPNSFIQNFLIYRESMEIVYICTLVQWGH